MVIYVITGVCLDNVIKSSQQSLKNMTMTGFFYFYPIFLIFILCTTNMYYIENFIFDFICLNSNFEYNFLGISSSNEFKIIDKSSSSILLNR